MFIAYAWVQLTARFVVVIDASTVAGMFCSGCHMRIESHEPNADCKICMKRAHRWCYERRRNDACPHCGAERMGR